MATLGLTWGDGSGTGAGGTFNLVSSQSNDPTVRLDFWKGVWSFSVTSFSSNRKEMRTLLQHLEHEQSSKESMVTIRRLLYH